MSVEENLKQQLKKLPDTTILYLSSITNEYYRAIMGTMDFMVNTLGYGGVYISATRPVSEIRLQLEASGISTQDIQFVDSVVYLVGGKTEDDDKIAYVESPAMLETIMLKVDWQLKQVRSKEKFVFFDSMNGLTVYNEEKLLMEFIHVFANYMRLKDIYTVLISVTEQTPDTMDSNLKLNCDDTVIISPEEIRLIGQTINEGIPMEGALAQVCEDEGYVKDTVPEEPGNDPQGSRPEELNERRDSEWQ